MVEKLLSMKVGQTKEFNRIDYDTVISTKSRLKRQEKGEWQSELSKDGFFIKRTA